MATVRPEIPEDVPEIRRINELAFGRPAEADLVEALRNAGKATLSLVALEDNQIVGHILLSRVTIGSPPVSATFSPVGLGPLAVLPDRQGRCIGSALVQTALYGSRKLGHDCVVVLGHSKYYPRFGFVPASRFGLRCEYKVPDEVFMAIELRDGVLAGHEGVVRYQPEFDEV